MLPILVIAIFGSLIWNVVLISDMIFRDIKRGYNKELKSIHRNDQKRIEEELVRLVKSNKELEYLRKKLRNKRLACHAKLLNNIQKLRSFLFGEMNKFSYLYKN